MVVTWKEGKPELAEHAIHIKQYFVKTNKNNLNIGLWSAFFDDWVCFAPLLQEEKVTHYLDGLEV